jgi:hypothetical protein
MGWFKHRPKWSLTQATIDAEFNEDDIRRWLQDNSIKYLLDVACQSWTSTDRPSVKYREAANIVGMLLLDRDILNEAAAVSVCPNCGGPIDSAPDRTQCGDLSHAQVAKTLELRKEHRTS